MCRNWCMCLESACFHSGVKSQPVPRLESYGWPQLLLQREHALGGRPEQVGAVAVLYCKARLQDIPSIGIEGF